MIIKHTTQKYKEFKEKYDDKNLEFNNLKYRPGASFTGHFGIEKGYEVIDGKLEFNTVRIHSGVDRGAGEIFAPFDFDFALFTDYGEKHVYGSLLRLFNLEYLFEMRIVHIFPHELDKDFKKLVETNSRIPRNTRIGIAGDYGMSSGRHTHTEFISIKATNEVFDILLRNRFSNSQTNYTQVEIEKFYREIPKFKKVPITEIKSHWADQIIKRNIYNGTINKYRYVYRDWFYGNEYKTRYSSEFLFNRL